MKKSFRVAAISVVAAASLSVIGVGTAHAASCTAFTDPSGKTINGWGSQTIQDVFGGLTDGYTFNSHTYSVDTFGKTVGSWNSINPSSCALNDKVTPITGGDTFERPNGSGDGRAALSAAFSSKNTWISSITGDTNTLNASASVKAEEISFSRSSSLPKQSTWEQANPSNDNLEFIPEAIDAVGVAEQVNGTIGTSDNKVDNFTTATLTNIYNDTAYTQNAGSHTAGDVIITGGYPFLVTSVSRGGTFTDAQVVPVLPEESSGTRSFFLSAINAASYDQAIVAEENGTARQEENNASADLSVTDINAALALNTPAYTVPATSIDIVPFSGAQLIEQEHGITGNNGTVGNTTTGSFFPTINGDTLSTGTGTGAGIGTLQTAQAPQVTFGDSVVGDFARYVFGVLPTSGAASGLQTWLDTTLPAAVNGPNSVWSDFGFDPVGSTFASNSSHWIFTSWQN